MNQGYITKITVKNYRSIADLTIQMPKLTVLVGKNGSGKSNFVDVLRFVSEALQFGLDSAVKNRGGIGRIRRWSSKGRPFDVLISLHLVINDIESEYTFTLGGGKRNEYGIKRELYRHNSLIIFERENNKWIIAPQPLLDLPIQKRALTLLLLGNLPEVADTYKFLTSMNFYTIFPNVLRPPQKPTTPYPLLEHGENLASALRDFLSLSEWSIDLKNQLEKVVTGVSNLRVVQVGSYLVIRLKYEDGSEFDLEQESDGTLRVLGLLLALYQQPSPTLIAIEEPELAIHPGALATLREVIEEAALRSQIIVTTHNPDLISGFDVDKLFIVERTLEGTEIGPIDETQRHIINEELFSTSDLLRIEGLRRAPSPQV